jgi:hypothetical protein
MREDAGSAISATWYVLVTRPDGESVFATMGPYPTEAEARGAAEAARVVHYRVGQAGHGDPVVSALGSDR